MVVVRRLCGVVVLGSDLLFLVLMKGLRVKERGECRIGSAMRENRWYKEWDRKISSK